MSLDIKPLLKLRKEIKDRKPLFKRQDYPKKKALGEKWRRPAGIHSKKRRKFRGAGPYVGMGYSSPRLVRGLTPEGFKGIIIHSIADLKKLTEKAAYLGATVGTKKKIAILEEAKKLGVRILNIKNAETYIKEVKDKLKSHKEAAKKKREGKKKAEPKKEAPKAEEKHDHKDLTHDEKKKAENEEKKKIIEGR